MNLVKDLSNVTAAILAGGLGTRLRSVVSDRPKILAEVCRRPFLAYLLDQLAAIKIKKVVLCIGHLGEKVRTAFGDTYGHLTLFYSQETSPIGTAGALRLALPLLQSDPVLVMNGDSFLETDLMAFWNCHCAKGAQVTLLLTNQVNTKRYGRVNINAAGCVLSFHEKDDQDGPGWVNGGRYFINHHLLQVIPEGMVISLERDMLPAWVSRGLYGYCSAGRFLDIGTPEAYAAAEQFFNPEDRLGPSP